jgi:Tfp pilus assembly protein PilF
MSSQSISNSIDLLISDLNRYGVESNLVREVSIKLKEHYNKLEYWIELASILRVHKNYIASEKVYKTALQIHAKSAVLWNNYNVLLKAWGKLDDALAACDKAIFLDPGYASPLEGKGKIFEELHRFDDAIEYYLISLEINPKNCRVLNNLGVCLLGKENEKEAIDYFLKAISVNADFTDSLFNLAGIHIRNRDYDKARPHVEKLSKILPGDKEVMQMGKAINKHSSSSKLEISIPSAKSLESKIKPEIRILGEQLKGNPKSIFISYAWNSSKTKAFAAKLCEDLIKSGYSVVLDRNFNYEVYEILYLLIMCQNVIVFNDVHYVESCLLGKVPITEASSPYPSFAFPPEMVHSKEYIGEVFKITAVVWEVAKILGKGDKKKAAEMAIQIADPKSFEKLTGLRIFIEGWRIDEIQMVFHNLKGYRSFSVIYLEGENCLAGYPVCDFSKPEYYEYSLNALKKILNASSFLPGDLSPIKFNVREDIDWNDYIYKDSPIKKCKFWKISDEKTMVWRPSLTDDGSAAAIIQQFYDWEQL